MQSGQLDIARAMFGVVSDKGTELWTVDHPAAVVVMMAGLNLLTDVEVVQEVCEVSKLEIGMAINFDRFADLVRALGYQELEELRPTDASAVALTAMTAFVPHQPGDHVADASMGPGPLQRLEVDSSSRRLTLGKCQPVLTGGMCLGALPQPLVLRALRMPMLHQRLNGTHPAILAESRSVSDVHIATRDDSMAEYLHKYQSKHVPGTQELRRLLQFTTFARLLWHGGAQMTTGQTAAVPVSVLSLANVHASALLEQRLPSPRLQLLQEEKRLASIVSELQRAIGVTSVGEQTRLQRQGQVRRVWEALQGCRTHELYLAVLFMSGGKVAQRCVAGDRAIDLATEAKNVLVKRLRQIWQSPGLAVESEDSSSWQTVQM
jgi:hypothetical protein